MTTDSEKRFGHLSLFLSQEIKFFSEPLISSGVGQGKICQSLCYEALPTGFPASYKTFHFIF